MSNQIGKLAITGMKGINGDLIIDPSISGKILSGDIRTRRPVKVTIKTEEGVHYIEEQNPNMEWKFEL